MENTSRPSAPGSPLEIITTSDGSTSLYNPALNETYHSRHGAVNESRHVFIKEGLLYQMHNAQFIMHNGAINIFEVGLGTGLNCLLTVIEADKYPHIQFNYTAIETVFLGPEIVDSINYPEQLNVNRQLFHQIHAIPNGIPQNLTSNFSLTKIDSSILTYSPTHHFDVVYFDAFAPEKQPEMWQPEIFGKMYNMLNNNGILVTYCAQGQFKRNLKAQGFVVERVPGPPNKREMTRAKK